MAEIKIATDANFEELVLKSERPTVVDANPGLSQAFNILSIPVIAFFKPGSQPQGVVGFRPLEQLEQTFNLSEYALAESPVDVATPAE